jgi:hypothetical protein
MREQIYHAVCGAGRAVTRKEVARMVKRKPARWINDHLDSLVESKHLKRTEYTWYNGMPVFFYEIAR